MDREQVKQTCLMGFGPGVRSVTKAIFRDRTRRASRGLGAGTEEPVLYNLGAGGALDV